MTVRTNDEVLQDIRDILLKTKKTIATAESVTSGNLQVFLSHAKDASKFFQGGITTYNLGQKYKHLAVEPIHAQECDCVSEKVASQMALYTCKLFNSDYGLGITGYASRQAEKDKNDLYAYIAIAENDKILLSEKLTAESEDSIEIQEFYSLRLLERFSHVIKKES